MIWKRFLIFLINECARHKLAQVKNKYRSLFRFLSESTQKKNLWLKIFFAISSTEFLLNEVTMNSSKHAFSTK